MTRLQRPALITDRKLDFFDEPALTRQMGSAKPVWPILSLKELIDNSLDAAESIEVLPEITVILEPNSLTVTDNGPGLTAEVVEHSLDYSVRVSTNRFFVCPTRGQQGNALKCIFAAACVATGMGLIEINSRGIKHQIQLALDPVTSLPHASHTCASGSVTNGTSFKLHWPEIASSSIYDPEEYSSRKPNVRDVVPDLMQAFAAFNPHASFVLVSEGQKSRWPATDPFWRKWRSSDGSSPHWYATSDLEQLIASYKRNGIQRSLRDFLGDFSGISGTQYRKRILKDAGLVEAHFDDLVLNNRLDKVKIERLLAAMQKHSRPVRPQRLGILGENHVMQALSAYDADPLRYRRSCGIDGNGLPYVVEVGFGLKRLPPYKLVLGLNNSCALKIPSQFISETFARCHIQTHDPIIVFIHQATPRFTYADQGKATVEHSPESANALVKLLISVTKDFVKAKRKAMRSSQQDQLSAEQRESLRQRNRKCTEEEQIKAAAYSAMPAAYLIVSDGGKLPVNARQMMYQVRPFVLQATGGKSWKNSNYFTQELLPDYQAEHAEECRNWNIVYDARGHLREPHHTGSVDLSTLGVREYISAWESGVPEWLERPAIHAALNTVGPRNCFKNALFIEKEGFDPLLNRAQIAERFDVAIFSSKGQSTTATRMLVEALSSHGVTILILHDFDRAGLLILHYLSNNSRRFRFNTAPRVIDLGLRLVDVKTMALQTEPVSYRQQKHPGEALASVMGITRKEIDFLVTEQVQHGHWTGHRVELNAMTSPQFINWLESKFHEHGVSKVMPDKATVQNAYRRAMLIRQIETVAEELTQKARCSEIAAPHDLVKRISRLLTEIPSLSWYEAVREIARERRS